MYSYIFQEQENKLLSITATLKSSKKDEKKEKSLSHVGESIVYTQQRKSERAEEAADFGNLLFQQGNSNRWCMILKIKIIFFFPCKAVFSIVNTFIPMQTQALPIYPWSNNYIAWSYNFNIPTVLKELSGGLGGDLILFKRINPAVQQMPYRMNF